MPDFADLERAFFDALYTYRIPIAASTLIAAAIVAVVAARRGWFAAARRHPGRSAILLAVVLAVGIPAGWYLASPIFIRTELIEPDPIAAAEATPPPVPVASTAPATAGPTAVSSPARPAASASPVPAPPTAPPFEPGPRLSGTFTGTDDFHFGRGTATIVETAPGTYVLRLEEFSVRNGPDLFVYLSPDSSDYVDGALELGRLKATDGAFSYTLPPGTDPADYASALIWCKQFSHLFAVAPFAPA